VLTLNELSRRTGVSFPTAAKSMTNLVDLGIVRELTGGQRNRVFAYDRYLAILNEGTEPL
jgi:Fic family protein